MAFTQAQLDALETAIATGTLGVTTGNKKVRYHSLDEMIRLRDLIKNQLAADSQTQSSRASFAAFMKDNMWLDDLIGVFAPVARKSVPHGNLTPHPRGSMSKTCRTRLIW